MLRITPCKMAYVRLERNLTLEALLVLEPPAPQPAAQRMPQRRFSIALEQMHVRDEMDNRANNASIRANVMVDEISRNINSVENGSNQRMNIDDNPNIAPQLVDAHLVGQENFENELNPEVVDDPLMVDEIASSMNLVENGSNERMNIDDGSNIELVDAHVDDQENFENGLVLDVVNAPIGAIVDENAQDDLIEPDKEDDLLSLITEDGDSGTEDEGGELAFYDPIGAQCEANEDDVSHAEEHNAFIDSDENDVIDFGNNTP